MFMITNSGFDRESVCWRYHEYVTKILKGTMVNDRLFGYIGTLDPCDEHWLEGQEQPVDNCTKCDRWDIEGPHWFKANPNLDVIPGREYLRNQVRKGLDMPAEQNTVRRLNFGYWTNQATRWMSMQAWDGCAKPIDYDKLKGRRCILGIDLANTVDIAAVALLFVPERLKLQSMGDATGAVDYSIVDIDSLDDDFVILPYFFIPEGTIEEAKRRDNVPYDAWVNKGLIETTPGNVIDYEFIKHRIGALKDVYPIRTKYDQGHEIALAGYDPWNATQFANDMAADYGLNMIEVRQGYQTMSEPTKEMARIVRAGRLRHGGNPVLRWMADNIIVKTDPAGNIKPDKEKSKKKIDGIVALIIALSLAIRQTDAGPSVYESRGVLRV